MIISAVNNNTPETEKLIASANEKIARLNKWAAKVKSGDVKVKGYPGDGIMVSVEKAIIEYGAENIFYWTRSYRSHYHDDYCTFYYYNNVTGEEFTDEWATAFAAPAFDRYEDCVTLQEALAAGLLNKELVLEKRRPQYYERIKNICKNFAEITPELAEAAHLRVEVKGGRKWKGYGILVSTFTTSYQYATPMFRNHSSGFGRSTTRHAKVWDVTTNTVEVCTYGQCKFPDIEKMKEAYAKMLTEWVDSLTPADMTTIRIIEPKEMSWKNFVMENYSMTLPKKHTWCDIDAEAKAEKEKAFHDKKIAELTEWAKTCTDVAEEEIPAFVERVYKKRYGAN